MGQPAEQYNTRYRTFDPSLSAQLRQEIYDEDIGQNSWLTAYEYRIYATWLAVPRPAHVPEAVND